jgi:hypothetical protein
VDEFFHELWGGDQAPRGESAPLLARLGLPEYATDSEIRAAFRAAALEAHPDHGGEDEEMATLITLYRNWRDGGAS